MSFQICHCGWSKVTTYHGLRTHQGKKGCTPKGIHIPENQMFRYLPPSYQPSRIKLEDLATDIFKSPMGFDSSEFKSLKEVGNPGSNQNLWSNNWEQMYPQMDNWAILGTPVKEQKVFLTPNFPILMNSGQTQTPEQEMYKPMLHPEQNSQQMVPISRNTKTPEFTFGSQLIPPKQTDKSSLWETLTNPMRPPPTQGPLTESNTSFFQTPPPSTGSSTSSDKTRRMLDFSSVPVKATEDSQIVTNTYRDAEIENGKEREAKKLLQARQDMMRVQIQQKIHIREQKMAEVRSAVKGCTGSLDAEWLQINNVFSEVIRAVEDARQKALEPLEKWRRKVKKEAQNLLQALQREIDRLRDSIAELDRHNDLKASPLPDLDDTTEIKNLKIDTSFSFGTLRATTSTMMKEIHWHLENLSSLELKRIATFAVDVKLDSATAHQCLVLSSDGKSVRDGGEKPKAPDAPERFDMFGSVLGINCLNRGRSYWEVEVKNKTGWDLGVARRSANRKGVLEVNTDNGYWVAVHFEDRKYAALTVPPTSLPLKEKPQKVGVFVDYEEGVASFYDVTNKSHIFSFTDCLFRDDIFPYFSPHLKMNDKNANPLVISSV